MVKTSKSNLIAIDIARAVASLGVFSYHQSIGNQLVHYTKLRIFDSIDFFGSTFAVPFFFLISGYCIHLSNLKYVDSKSALPISTYFKRRFLRIFPPYLLAVLFSLFSNAYTHYVPSAGGLDILVHAFCLQGFSTTYFGTINVVFWTITVEIAFYIIYPLFYYFRLKYNLNIAMIGVFLVSFCSILYFSFQKNITAPQFYLVSNIWFSWCIGAYIADRLHFDSKAFNNLIFKLLYLLILALAIVLLVYNNEKLALITYQFKIIIWTGPLVFILSKEPWLKKQKSIFLNLLVCCGLSSYSLYLLHVPLIFLKNYIVRVYVPANLGILAFIAGIFIILLLAWFNYIYVEKTFINLGKKKQGK